MCTCMFVLCANVQLQDVSEIEFRVNGYYYVIYIVSFLDFPTFTGGADCSCGSCDPISRSERKGLLTRRSGLLLHIFKNVGALFLS